MAEPQRPVQLSQEALAHINASAAAMIAEAFCMQDERARDREASPQPQPRQAMLRPQEARFYNPDRPAMIADTKAMTYFCIYVFTGRLRHSVDLKGVEAVKEVWTQCLQGQVMIWLSQVFSHDDKVILQYISVEDLAQSLIDQRSIRMFTQQLVRDTKACDANTLGQLQAVYPAFDSTIQSQLTEPNHTTTIDSFMSEIRSQESAMKKLENERRNDTARRTPYPGWSTT
ncbi:hypothetical protein FPRO04_13698 [Fusarium proliferatum]|nr:hypothetical protein FPRO04_13698 [Fusarium proliferatum]